MSPTLKEIQKQINGDKRTSSEDPSLEFTFDLMRRIELLLKEHICRLEQDNLGAAEYQSKRRECELRITQSARHPEHIQILCFKERFHLTDLEFQLLVLCLTIRLNPQLTLPCNLLTEKPGALQPNLRLATLLSGYDKRETMQARSVLNIDMPLRRYRLLRVLERDDCDFLDVGLEIEERIVDHFLNLSQPDNRFVLLLRPPSEEASHLSSKTVEQIRSLKADLAAGPHRAELIFFIGNANSGRNHAVHALAAEMQSSFLEVDARELLIHSVDPGDIFERLIREAALQNTDLSITHADQIFEDSSPEFQRCYFRLLGAIENYEVRTVFTLTTPPPVHLLPDHMFQRSIVFETPNFSQRRENWQTALQDDDLRNIRLSVDELAARYHFHYEQIQKALKRARALARLQQPDNLPTDVELLAACNSGMQKKLEGLARPVSERSAFDDLVLPADRLHQLRQISARLRYGIQVFDDWGFAERIPYGRGVCALFSGPSGSGKTMAAGAIADQLKLELYKINLAGVVSKYIGETEKNLDRIFTHLEGSGSILFFDEADALFGKRSEVKDAHDRYANIEIGYLLQRMEEYEGMTVLATNLRHNMDEAFMRRLDFIVEFPFPEKQDRKRIWENMFPAKTPLSDDINLDFLAKKLQVTGGVIKNIALTAAFLAAEEQTQIGMRHLMRAARQEYRKLGRAFLRVDFEPYFEISSEEAGI